MGRVVVIACALAFVAASLLGGVRCQVARGRVNYWEIREASGLAASRKHRGVIYTHNDSGDNNRIFAINEWGQHLVTYVIQGASARDWEDIAIGPGPDPNKDYIYIGDIGDNGARYPTKVVYRVEEPDPTRTPSEGTRAQEVLDKVETFEFTFPGHAGNANSETLMVDPLAGDLYIVRKTQQHPIQVFLARAGDLRRELAGTEAAAASATEGNGTGDGVGLDQGEANGAIPLVEFYSTCVDYTHECREEAESAEASGELVGGDISPSGLGLLIKSYRAVYYWRRSGPGENFFDSDPRMVPYVGERQGEAICWDANETGYFTLSEGHSPMLYYYPYQPHKQWVEAVNKWDEEFQAFDGWGSEELVDAAAPSEEAEPTAEEPPAQVGVAAAGGQAEGGQDDPGALEDAWRRPNGPRVPFSWLDLRAGGETRGRLLGDKIVAEAACSDLPDASGQTCQAQAELFGACPSLNGTGFCNRSCGVCTPAQSPPLPSSWSAAQANTQQLWAGRTSIPVDNWWAAWKRRHDAIWRSASVQAASGPSGHCSPSQGLSGGAITAKKAVSGEGECCELCEQANERARADAEQNPNALSVSRRTRKCDTWSFCKREGGCRRFPRGTCLLKRSLDPAGVLETDAWSHGEATPAGSRARGARVSGGGVVMGVREGPFGPEGDGMAGLQSGPAWSPPDGWPQFFRQQADRAWRESMYLQPLPAPVLASPPSPFVLAGRGNATGALERREVASLDDWLCQKVGGEDGPGQNGTSAGVTTEQVIEEALRGYGTAEGESQGEGGGEASARLECPSEGCHALRGTYKGLVVAETNFPAASRCCEACRQARESGIPPFSSSCDVFSYCPSANGCGLMQPFGHCMLKVVSEDPSLGLAWSFNPLKPYTSGKPA